MFNPSVYILLLTFPTESPAPPPFVSHLAFVSSVAIISNAALGAATNLLGKLSLITYNTSKKIQKGQKYKNNRTKLLAVTK